MNEQSTQEPLALFHAKWLKKSLTIGAWEAGVELERLHEEVGRLNQALKQASDQTEPVHADESMWCRYIACMIGEYLCEPVGSDKEKAIAGIIERRLWNLPKRAPAVAQGPEAENSLRTDALCQLSYCNGLKAGWNFCVADDEAGFSRAMNGVVEAVRALKESRSQEAPAVAVNEQMYNALKMVMDDPQSLEGRPRTFECVTEAIAAYEAAKKGSEM